jgi:hypothetical protein
MSLSKQLIDTKYLMTNCLSIVFYVCINSYTTYLFITNTFLYNQLKIMYAIGIYEFFNIFYELSLEKKNWEFITHHIAATIVSFLFIAYYDVDIYIELQNDMIYSIVMAISGNLYLTIQFVFPKFLLPKIVFFFTFFIYRFIITIPFLIKMYNGEYYTDDIVSKTILSCGAFIYFLSLYWGYKIIKYIYKMTFTQNKNINKIE